MIVFVFFLVFDSVCLSSGSSKLAAELDIKYGA